MGRAMSPGTWIIAKPKGAEGNPTVIHGEVISSEFEMEDYPIRHVSVNPSSPSIMLSERYWDINPIRKTFAEQFAELPLGATFTTSSKHDGVKRVKISETQYMVLSGALKGETFDAKLGRGPYEDIIRVEV